MRALALGALVVPLAAACIAPAEPPDVEAARAFDRFPLYWAGEEFEGRPLVYVDARPESNIVTFVYGDCDPPPDGGCSPPLQIQITPLCFHLEIVRLSRAGEERTIRGAPVGRADGAPVLLTSAVQIRAYWGEGADAGIAARALAALRSVNDVAPVVEGDESFSPAPRDVLAGERPCA